MYEYETAKRVYHLYKKHFYLSDYDPFSFTTKELNDACMAASQDMYNATQGAQQGPQPGAEQAGASNAENVTDAEFEEVK